MLFVDTTRTHTPSLKCAFPTHILHLLSHILLNPRKISTSNHFHPMHKQVILTENCTIPFKGIIFKRPAARVGEAEELGTQVTHTLAKGRMVLTNKRLLFICLRPSTAKAKPKPASPTLTAPDQLNPWINSAFEYSGSFFAIDIKEVIHARFESEVRIEDG